MDFNQFEVVERTFSRKKGAVRGQDYEGLKFRRYISNKAGSEGQKQETLTFSDKMWSHLDLDNFACTQANTPDGVFLLVVEDQDKVKPVAKFCRQSFNEDGTKQGKGKSFSNPFLVNALIEKKVLDAETMENQYLSLVDTTAETANLPSNVKGVYRFVIDENVDAGVDADEKEEEEASAQATPARDDF